MKRPSAVELGVLGENGGGGIGGQMSWARVDDGTWEHPKFEGLRAEGQYQAIALWVLALSYCGRKQNAKLTVAEATMLLMCSEAGAKQACDVLRSRGLLDVISASEQNASYQIHDWEQYRSKDEAKVRAGRQGGKKSAESRRGRVQANAKHTDIMFQADAKQTSSPGPDPDPGPDPVPDPGPDTTQRASSVAIRQAIDLERIASDEGWSVMFSSTEIRDLRALLPIGADETAYALTETRQKKPKRPIGYFLGVITGQRADALAGKRPRSGRFEKPEEPEMPYHRPSEEIDSETARQRMFAKMHPDDLARETNR